MRPRFTASPIVKGLFSNLPIESGLTDEEIVASTIPRMPHKTFSRLRIAPPAELTGDQVLMIARLAEKTHSGSDAAQVLGMIRGGHRPNLDSLAERHRRHGDAAIEQLIGNVESGEHSLSIVNDSALLAHRVFRGIFGEADAVAIFDRRAMFVLPRHRNSIRYYDVAANSANGNLIRHTVRLFHRMRRFRTHRSTVSGVTTTLRNCLSYRLPGWRLPGATD